MNSSVLQSEITHPPTEFQKTNGPLINVYCQSDANKITLTGSVTSFYHLQKAIESARKISEGRRIEVFIKVVPPSIRFGERFCETHGIHAPEEIETQTNS